MINMGVVLRGLRGYSRRNQSAVVEAAVDGMEPVWLAETFLCIATVGGGLQQRDAAAGRRKGKVDENPFSTFSLGRLVAMGGPGIHGPVDETVPVLLGW